MNRKKEITLLIGAPASCKSHVCSELADKFEVVEHDKNIHKDYAKEIIRTAKKSTKPILAETPFAAKEIITPLKKAGFKVTPYFIVESEAVLKDRYKAREGKEIPKGHIALSKSYLEKAKKNGHQHGTSKQIAKLLKGRG